MKQFQLNYNASAIATPVGIVTNPKLDGTKTKPPGQRKIILGYYAKNNLCFASMVDLHGCVLEVEVPIYTLHDEMTQRTAEEFNELLQYFKVIRYALSVIPLPGFEESRLVYHAEFDMFYMVDSTLDIELKHWDHHVRFIANDSQVYRASRLEESQQYAHKRLSDKYINDIKVQAKSIKVKVKCGNVSETRRYSSFLELMSNLRTTSGGTIRRVKNDTAKKLVDSVLHVFVDKDTTTYAGGIWTYVEDNKLYSFKVPAASMEKYITTLTHHSTIRYHYPKITA